MTYKKDDNSFKNNKETLVDYMMLIMNLMREKKPLRQDFQYYIDRVGLLLMKVPGFMNFTFYNGIEISHVLKAVKYIEVVEYNEGDIIFYQGELSSSFYIVIEGTVQILLHKIKPSVRENNNQMQKFSNFNLGKMNSRISRQSVSLSKVNMLDQYFPSKFYNTTPTVQFTEGMCFGEWGLMYKQNRSSTAQAISKVKIFKINERAFKENFMLSIMKTDLDRKEFLKSKISYFSTIDKVLFKKLYLEISPFVSIYI